MAFNAYILEPATQLIHDYARDGHRDHMEVASTFEDVDQVSPFQMAVALSKIESAGRLHPAFQSYVRKAMRLYKKRSRKHFAAINSISEESYCYYAKFRGARTWKDIANAFASVLFRTPQEEETKRLRDRIFDKKMRDYFRHQSDTDSPLEPGSPIPIRKQPSAKELLAIQEHFEDIIDTIVEELDDQVGFRSYSGLISICNSVRVGRSQKICEFSLDFYPRNRGD